MRRAIPILAFLALLGPVADAGTAPRCFGAASRDHVTPCHNERLERMVRPTPRQAMRRPNAPCTIPVRTYPLACEFGVPPDDARRRIALIGDSHAVHWRAALAPVAEERRWAGFSLSRNGCPLSAARPVLRAPLDSQCLSWRAAIHEWLREHPRVDTVVVSQHRVRVRGPYSREVEGYLAAWRSLPASVKKIVVIRDTPARPGGTRGCVERAIARRAPAGRLCASPRSAALREDPAADAARRAGGRVHLVDLTRFFCDARRCFPVVGGVLTHKDEGHMTAAFGRTLAPYLRAALSAIGLRN